MARKTAMTKAGMLRRVSDFLRDYDDLLTNPEKMIGTTIKQVALNEACMVMEMDDDQYYYERPKTQEEWQEDLQLHASLIIAQIRLLLCHINGRKTFKRRDGISVEFNDRGGVDFTCNLAVTL